jgi:hypothetical protein
MKKNYNAMPLSGFTRFLIYILFVFGFAANAQELKTICPGGSVTLYTTTYGTTTWSPATGLSATTGSSVIASPAVTTTYTVTSTLAEYSTTKTITVEIRELDVIPSAVSICNNAENPVSLTATDGKAGGMALIDENFDEGVLNYPFYYNAIPDWTVDKSGSTQGAVNWQPSHIQNGDSQMFSGFNGGYSNTILNDKLISPAFSTKGYEDIVLTLSNYYVARNADQIVAIEISTDNGVTWSVLKSYLGGGNIYGNIDAISLKGYLNYNNVKLRFNHRAVGSDGYGYWAINNLKVTASRARAVWAPQSGLFSDALATVPYTGQEVHEVYTQPSSDVVYTATTDFGNCPFNDNAKITVVPSPAAIDVSGDNAICYGASAVLTATGATTYAWSPTTGLNNGIGAEVIASPLETITYTVIGTSNGCSSSGTFTVVVNNPPTLIVSPNAPEICTGDSVSLSATGADAYRWSPATGLDSTTGAVVTASPTETTTYTVTGTSADGCTTSQDITVIVNSTSISVTPSLVLCAGNSVSLTADGADSYTWSPSIGLDTTSGTTVVASPAVTTTYTVTGTSNAGCGDTKTVTVTVQQPITASAGNTALVAGDTTTLTANGADTYTWSPADGLNTTTGASVIAKPLQTTTYTVTGTTLYGCSTTAQVTINVTSSPNPVVTAIGETQFCPGKSVVLTASTPGENPAIIVGRSHYSIFYPDLTNDFTIEYWLQAKGSPPEVGGIWNYEGTLLSTYDTSYNLAYTVAVNSGKLVFGYGLNTTEKVTSLSSVNTGEWMHVAITRSIATGRLKIFINGNEEASVVTSNQTPTAISYASIGGGYAISGNVDNLRLWTTARTASQIQQYINVPVESAEPGLAADYRLNEGSGTISYSNSDTSTYMLVYNSNGWSSRPENPKTTTWSNGETGSIIEVAGSGSYTVSYSNNGITYTSVPVVVNVVPLTVTIAADASSICPGKSVQLQASASNPNAYFTWSPATGLSSAYDAQVVASPSVTTTYTVTAATPDGCYTSENITIQVIDDLIVATEKTALCPGEATVITASGGDEYTWSPATGLSSTTGETVVANPNATTTYTVSTTTASGCVTSKNITIEINPLEATVTASSLSMCGGEPVTLTASSNFDNPALQFSGDDSGVIFSPIFADFTVEFWMKTLQIGNAGNWDNGSILFGATKSGNLPFYGLSVSGNKLAFGVNSASAATNTTIHSTSDINNGQWKHVAVTRSAQTGKLQLYIDGQLEADAEFADRTYFNFTGQYLGKLPTSPNSYAGSVDDMKFWNSVRTQAQIKESALASVTPATPELINYFTFNENTGYAIHDNYNPNVSYYIYNTPTWDSRVSTPLTYLWSNGATTREIEVTEGGNYSVAINAPACSAQSEEVTISEIAPVTTLTASSTTVCLGGSVVLTAGGGDSYNWLQSPGLTNVSGNVATATPKSTTTYYVYINTGSCQNLQQITINVEKPVAITPEAPSICANSAPVELSAVGGNIEEVIFAQDFNSGIGAWTFENSVQSTTSWKVVTSPYSFQSFPLESSNGGMMLVSDATNGATNTTILSPALSTVGYNNALLTFETVRLPGLDNTTVSLDISTNGGTTWTQLRDYRNVNAFVSESIDLTDYLNIPNLRLRFVNVSGQGSFWMLDDIKIKTFNPDPVTWSPKEGLFINVAGTQPYNGEATNIVYAKPAVTTVYTAALTAASVCAASSVTVNVTTAGSATVSSDQTLCYGSFATGVTLSNNTANILKWQKADNPAFTGAIDINNTSSTLSGTDIGAINVTTYVRAILDADNCDAYSSIAVLAVNATIWNGNAWSNGAPVSYYYSAVINGNYNSTKDGEIKACTLTVTSGNVIIASGDNFLIEGAVTVNNNNATLTINHNANLIQVNDVNNTGTISVIKESAPMYRLDYTLWASPVAGQKLKAFSPETLDNRFYMHNPLNEQYATVLTPATTDMDEGKSYLIRVSNNYPAYVSDAIAPTQWQGTFTGVPNNGTVAVQVTPLAGGAISGFNSIGNPYPSSINIAAFFEANQNNLANDTPIYFWRKKNDAATSTYASLTLAGYNANNGNPFGDSSNGVFSNPNESENWVINSGQGFIVKAVNNTVVFDNSMRAAENNGQMFRSAIEAKDKSRLWLNITNSEGHFGQTTIAYTPKTTLGLDYGWDGSAMTDGSVAIYSIVGASKLGIQARPTFDPADEVTLEYKVTSAGSYRISLDHFDGVFAQGQEIYLRDNILGVRHNLKKPYDFTTEAGITAGRFDVVYAEASSLDLPTFDSNSIIIYKEGNTIKVSTGNVDMKSVSVYDIRGRLLYSANDINKTETAITNLHAQEQMLIVEVTTVNDEKASKKIIF